MTDLPRGRVQPIQGNGYFLQKAVRHLREAGGPA